MRILIITAFLCSAAAAHPGIGIVRDGNGNIFYTDLTHVWRIDPAGQRTIAVRNVHSHELCIDASNAVFGEHLWYNGEARNTWGHFVWRRNADGRIDTVIGKREGFRSEYGFVRDARGTMYWVDRGDRERIMKRTPDGAVSLLSTAVFSGVGWLHATANGTVYVRERGTLHRITSDGTLRTLATVSRDGNSGLLHGIWSDRHGNVYLADGKLRQVTRVDTEGNVSAAVRYADSWAPSGGLVAPDGALWLLEYSPANAVRVRRIGPDGNIRTF